MTNPNLRGKGHIPDPAKHMVSGAHLPLGALVEPKREKNYLFGATPPIRNQGGTSKCTGFAFARSVQTTLHPEWHNDFVISPEGIYTIGIAIDREDVNVDLVDEGAMPNQVARGIVEYGAGMWSDWPFIADGVAEPNLNLLEKSFRVRVPAFYQVKDEGERRRARWCQLIDAGIAPAFAVYVDGEHEDFNGKGVLSAPTENRPSNHMICGVGYEDYGNIILWGGSWDITWGDAGFGRGDYSFLQAIDSIYFPKKVTL